MFENVKIKTLLMGSFAVLLLLVAVVGYSGYEGLQNVDARIYKTDQMDNLVNSMQSASLSQLEYELTNDDTSATEVNGFVDDIIARTEALKPTFADPVNVQRMNDIQAAALQYNTAFNQYVALQKQKEDAITTMTQSGAVVQGLANELWVTEEESLSLSITQNADDAVLKKHLADMEHSAQAEKLMLEARGDVLRFMFFGDEKYINSANDKLDETTEIAKILESTLETQEEKEKVQAVITATSTYKSDFNSYVSSVEQQKVANEEMYATGAEVMAIIQEAQGVQQQRIQEDMASAVQTMIIMVVLAIIVGAVMALFISRMISKQVSDMLDAANKIAAGDLTVKLDNRSSNELGQLSGAISSMVGNLSGLISKVQMNASKVASTSQEIAASSEEMTAASGQISDVVNEISGGAQNQSSRAMEVSNAMNDMSSSVQEIASNAQNAAQSATRASETIRSVGTEAEKLLIQMDEIQGSVSDSSGVIRDLDGKSKQIGEIVSLITSIADQTNLLALNAAIEAARAGEHGKGFAVVANEVRQLAEDSSKAAKEIAVLIRDIQYGSNKAVDSMEKGTSKVAIGAQSLRTTVDAVKSIVDGSEQIARMAQEIAAAAQEQAASIQEITSSIEEVSAISEQSAAGTEQASASVQEQTASMEELSASAQQLADLANGLMQETAKFRIE